MKIKHLPLLVILCLCLGKNSFAQQNMIYNHYYINPFLYNPSFIAPTGYSEVYLNYRKQWTGFEGAPQTGTFNLQLPLSYKSGLAFTAFQDEAGMIKTTSGLISFSYQVFLGKSIVDLHKIGFGISAGFTSSRIKMDEADDFQDPVLGNSTSSLDGQFGIHYQFKNFKLAFAIPRLFDTNVAAEKEFTTNTGITQIKNTISSISYDFQVSPSFSIEPIVSYRTTLNLDPQFEALTSFKFSNIGWIGGAYRQDYGAFAFLGANIKEKIKVGYAYEFATDQTDRVGQGSHEVQLIVRIGKKQFKRSPAVSKAQQVPAKIAPVAEEPKHDATEEKNPELKNEVQEDPINEVRQDHARQDEIAPTKHVNEPVHNTEVTQKTITPDRTEPVREEAIVKVEPVKKLNGEKLAPGHYVVVGAFQSLQNALNYTSTLKRAGYPASIAFQPERGYYIVHMLHSGTIEGAREMRDKYRQMSRYSFRDTWILSIEE